METSINFVEKDTLITLGFKNMPGIDEYFKHANSFNSSMGIMDNKNTGLIFPILIMRILSILSFLSDGEIMFYLFDILHNGPDTFLTLQEALGLFMIDRFKDKINLINEKIKNENVLVIFSKVMGTVKMMKTQLCLQYDCTLFEIIKNIHSFGKSCVDMLTFVINNINLTKTILNRFGKLIIDIKKYIVHEKFNYSIYSHVLKTLVMLKPDSLLQYDDEYFEIIRQIISFNSIERNVLDFLLETLDFKVRCISNFKILIDSIDIPKKDCYDIFRRVVDLVKMLKPDTLLCHDDDFFQIIKQIIEFDVIERNVLDFLLDSIKSVNRAKILSVGSGIDDNNVISIIQTIKKNMELKNMFDMPRLVLHSIKDDEDLKKKVISFCWIFNITGVKTYLEFIFTNEKYIKSYLFENIKEKGLVHQLYFHDLYEINIFVQKNTSYKENGVMKIEIFMNTMFKLSELSFLSYGLDIITYLLKTLYDDRNTSLFLCNAIDFFSIRRFETFTRYIKKMIDEDYSYELFITITDIIESLNYESYCEHFPGHAGSHKCDFHNAIKNSITDNFFQAMKAIMSFDSSQKDMLDHILRITEHKHSWFISTDLKNTVEEICIIEKIFKEEDLELMSSIVLKNSRADIEFHKRIIDFCVFYDLGDVLDYINNIIISHQNIIFYVCYPHMVSMRHSSVKYYRYTLSTHTLTIISELSFIEHRRKRLEYFISALADNNTKFLNQLFEDLTHFNLDELIKEMYAVITYFNHISLNTKLQGLTILSSFPRGIVSLFSWCSKNFSSRIQFSEKIQKCLSDDSFSEDVYNLSCFLEKRNVFSNSPIFLCEFLCSFETNLLFLLDKIDSIMDCFINDYIISLAIEKFPNENNWFFDIILYLYEKMTNEEKKQFLLDHINKYFYWILLYSKNYDSIKRLSDEKCRELRIDNIGGIDIGFYQICDSIQIEKVKCPQWIEQKDFEKISFENRKTLRTLDILSIAPFITQYVFYRNNPCPKNFNKIQEYLDEKTRISKPKQQKVNQKDNTSDFYDYRKAHTIERSDNRENSLFGFIEKI
jgi:hypothetical protein